MLGEMVTYQKVNQQNVNSPKNQLAFLITVGSG
jgi:hypothetical protein